MGDNEDMNVCYYGATHLSLVSSCAAAKLGVNVLVFDPSKFKIEELKAGQLDINEPGLNEVLFDNEKIRFSDDYSSLEEYKIIYMAKDVPTNDAGESDLSEIEENLEEIIQKTRVDTRIIILSQVPPGFTRKLEKRYPKREFFYQVETLIFGKALERALFPERIIFGVSENKQIPKEIKRFLDLFKAPLLIMNFESAELTKISINLFLMASLINTNMIAGVCEKVNADWSSITDALKLDKRIGQHAYLKPGLGFAGGNLERDLKTIKELAYGYTPCQDLMNVWTRNNQYHKSWASNSVKSSLDKIPDKVGVKIGVAGLTYKENTHSLKNSPSLHTISELEDFTIFAFDPVCKDQEIAKKFKFKMCKSFSDIFIDANFVLLLTPWSDFDVEEKEMFSLVEQMNVNNRFIIDPLGIWRKFKKQFEKLNLKYHCIGHIS